MGARQAIPADNQRRRSRRRGRLLLFRLAAPRSCAIWQVSLSRGIWSESGLRSLAEELLSVSVTRYPHHMPPKTPKERREQIEAQQNEPAAPGQERTAEGMQVETPSGFDFLANLRKVASRRLPKRHGSAGE